MEAAFRHEAIEVLKQTQASRVDYTDTNLFDTNGTCGGSTAGGHRTNLAEALNLASLGVETVRGRFCR